MNRSAATLPVVATSRLFRRVVLGTAFFVGLALALMPRSPTVHAQEPKNPPATAPAAPKTAPKSLSITDGRGTEIKIDVGEGGRASVTTTDPAPDARSDTGARAEAAGNDPASRRDGKARKRARATIDGTGTDREFDSFDQFVQTEPELAGMVVAVVAVVFLAPVLAIALILWYRMRKARMLNETMLKLAERGILPSADTMDALAGGKQLAAMAPYYEQAKQVRRKAAWSDLRKGVLMGGFGLALSVYSLLADREPNALGLVLLFVGLGFAVLWWFEQRHLVVAQNAPPGPGAGTTPGSPPPA